MMTNLELGVLVWITGFCIGGIVSTLLFIRGARKLSDTLQEIEAVAVAIMEAAESNSEPERIAAQAAPKIGKRGRHMHHRPVVH